MSFGRKVLFVVFKFVPFGCSVHILGSCSELGNWRPCMENKLEWNEGHLWVGKITVPNTVIEYKFAVINNQENIEWEQGANRETNFKTTDRIIDGWRDHDKDHSWQRQGELYDMQSKKIKHYYYCSIPQCNLKRILIESIESNSKNTNKLCYFTY